MSDTLVVAVSQSGTTTDTNRTVDLVRARGARVVSIVNRRSSDLTDKSDGVLYTSDGRDVEMSVASTKAFYSQVAAGFLLAYAIADLVAADPSQAAERSRTLAALRDLPDAMEQTLGHATGHRRGGAPARAAEAVLGGGRIRRRPHRRHGAADQALRALLQGHRLRRHRGQEAHRPLVRAAHPRVRDRTRGLERRRRRQGGGDLPGPQGHADRHHDRREPALRRGDAGAHRAGGPAAARVRAVHDGRPPVRLRGRAGHRRPGGAAPAGPGGDRAAGVGARSRGRRRPPAGQPPRRLRAGGRPASSTGSGAARTTATSNRPPRSGSSRCCATASGWCRSTPSRSSTDGWARPRVLIEDLTVALTAAIEELTRPIDAIKHQAKTVTVGISRADEGLLQVGLVREALDAGAARDRLSYRSLRTLAGLDPAVADVLGYTRYVVEGDVGHPRRPRSPRSTGAASPATSRCAPSGTRSCGAPSTGSPPSSRSRRRSAAATAAR